MKYFVERYKQKTTELKDEVARLRYALMASMEAEHKAINALMPERWKNRLLDEENETQKRELRQLKCENSLLENRLRQHDELLRKYEKLNVNFTEVKTFCPTLTDFLKKAIAMFGSELPIRKYRSQCRKLKEKIMKLCNSEAVHPAVRKLQDIFREREDSLFQWCHSPDIPAENNFAERSVRPVVIMRKISFGSQPEQGMHTREILSTVIQTAAARGCNVFEFMVKAIAATTNDPPPDLYQTLMPMPRP